MPSRERPDNNSGRTIVFRQLPVRYLSEIPSPIRLVSLGTLINRMGGYVTVFLTLILAARHVPPVQIGLALIFGAVFSIIGSWAGGVATSRFGGRLTIIAATAGSAIFTTLLIFFTSYVPTVVLICCISFFNRAYTPAAATVVGRASAPGERAKSYAFLQFSFNVGAAIGPVIATYLLTRSLTTLYVIDAVTSGLYGFLALRLPADAARRPAGSKRPKGQQSAKPLRSDHRYLLFCVSAAITAMVYGQYSGALPLDYKAHHYSLQVYGLMISSNAIAIIVFQLPVAALIKKSPVWIPLVAGQFMVCAAYAVLLAGLSLPLILVNVCAFTLGEMLVSPMRPVVAMTRSSEDTHGNYQGALSLAQTVGQVLGPSAGVFAFSFIPSLPWLCCVVLCLPAAGLPLALFVRKPSPASAQPTPLAGQS